MGAPTSPKPRSVRRVGGSRARDFRATALHLCRGPWCSHSQGLRALPMARGRPDTMCTIGLFTRERGPSGCGVPKNFQRPHPHGASSAMGVAAPTRRASQNASLKALPQDASLRLLPIDRWRRLGPHALSRRQYDMEEPHGCQPSTASQKRAIATSNEWHCKETVPAHLL